MPKSIIHFCNIQKTTLSNTLNSFERDEPRCFWHHLDVDYWGVSQFRQTSLLDYGVLSAFLLPMFPTYCSELKTILRLVITLETSNMLMRTALHIIIAKAAVLLRASISILAATEKKLTTVSTRSHTTVIKKCRRMQSLFTGRAMRYSLKTTAVRGL